MNLKKGIELATCQDCKKVIPIGGIVFVTNLGRFCEVHYLKHKGDNVK